MLTVTPEAGLAIRRLTEAEGAAASGGLRIDALSTEDKKFRYAFSVAATRDDRDEVVSESTTGSRVLLDARTAEQVAGMTLHVDSTVDGSAQFRLKPSL
jgi:Fe-S cluster assembly iron-binding protein IscA